jgi:SAM-dependent methyltransferase
MLVATLLTADPKSSEPPDLRSDVVCRLVGGLPSVIYRGPIRDDHKELKTASAKSLRRLARMGAPVKVLMRLFPGLNAAVWNLRYKLGLFNYLDSAGTTGAAVLMLVERFTLGTPKILDLGCGTSANLPLSAGKYRHYHGVDVSRTAIAKARALDRSNTSFEVADILTYVTSERYDAILLREVLYYFDAENIAGLLHRLAGLLELGGKIFIQMSHDPHLGEISSAVCNCGLSVLEERTKKAPSNGAEGVFIVLAPFDARPPLPAT